MLEECNDSNEQIGILTILGMYTSHKQLCTKVQSLAHFLQSLNISIFSLVPGSHHFQLHEGTMKVKVSFLMCMTSRVEKLYKELKQTNRDLPTG